jgi:chemotaxis protein methyltransferase CheR
VEFRVDSLGIAGGITQVFADLIHDRLGLTFEPMRHDQLADRLAPLVVARGLSSFMDYYYVLKYSQDAAEWGRVMDALAVPETYFWRESDQIRAIVHDVIPGLVEQAQGDTVRIWSVPCSTGEEPLTIAMMLAEAGWLQRAPIEILASDASPSAIARARAGRYGPRAFRNLAPALQEKYFERIDERTWSISPALQRFVRYDVVNLMDTPQVAAHASVPVVFCRNVFIYFSTASIQRVVGAFAERMSSPGYLCIGASESLLRLGTRFELREIGGSFVYVRGEAVPAAPTFTIAGGSERAS